MLSSLDATKLKITSINLVNGETLSLNWSSKCEGSDLDKVYYEVKLYSSEDKAQLLSINIPGRNLKNGFAVGCGYDRGQCDEGLYLPREIRPYQQAGNTCAGRYDECEAVRPAG